MFASAVTLHIKLTLHVLGDSSVRFHNAERVNFMVMSMTFSCILPRTIDNSFFM